MKKTTAIDFFGSGYKLAKALAISPQAVDQWPDIIPLKRQYEIQKLTGNKLKAVNPYL